MQILNCQTPQSLCDRRVRSDLTVTNRRICTVVVQAERDADRAEVAGDGMVGVGATGSRGADR